MNRTIQSWSIAEKRAKKSNRFPPFAPSGKEIEFYEKYLDLASRNPAIPKRALILGATPELRDASISRGLETIAVDASEQMMEKFSSLMTKAGDKFDKRIISDWLDMDFSKNHFGVVMGDGSLTNLATKKENELLLEILIKIVANGGYVVLRQPFYIAGFKRYTNINKLIDDYRSGVMCWEDFYMELRFNLAKEKFYDSRECSLDSKQTFDWFENISKEYDLTKEEIEKVLLFRNDVKNSMFFDKDFEKMFEDRGFKFIEDFHDRPYRFFNYLYMLAFQKK